MAEMNTLQMIKIIPKFVKWTRPLNDILEISWAFLSKIISGFKRPKSIFREHRERDENTSDFDDNDSK